MSAMCVWLAGRWWHGSNWRRQSSGVYGPPQEACCVQFILVLQFSQLILVAALSGNTKNLWQLQLLIIKSTL